MTTLATPAATAAPTLSPAAIIEGAKRLAAYRAVDEHFPQNARYVGIGSGSTVVYVVERIAQLPRDRTDHVVFIPTGFQSKELILKAGLKLGAIDMYTDLDVVFDGADEVDPFLNCIKGGGACLFQEKLVAISGRKFVVVAGTLHITRAEVERAAVVLRA
jgi:ribose 5-phosphate isomerase A